MFGTQCSILNMILNASAAAMLLPCVLLVSNTVQSSKRFNETLIQTTTSTQTNIPKVCRAVVLPLAQAASQV